MWWWMDMQDLGSSWIHWIGYDDDWNVREARQVNQQPQSRGPSLIIILRGLRALGIVIGTIALIVVIVAAVIVLIRLGHASKWGYAVQWTGFGQSKVNEGIQPAKTLWDWLDLLIIPLVLAIGGYLFTRSESRATQAAAERRVQEEALQAYMDRLSDLIMDRERPLRRANLVGYDFFALPQDRLSDLIMDRNRAEKKRPSSRLSRAQMDDNDLITIVRARTGTALARLDRNHKVYLVQFLYEAELLFANQQASIGISGLIESPGAVIPFAGLDLKEADFAQQILPNIDLTSVDLSDADLSGALLTGADLKGATLSNANLRYSTLRGVNLRYAYLRKANMSDTDLRDADLRDADLRRARLDGAILSNADFSRATGVSNESLHIQAKTLEGTTMPNGQKYEDWIKDREGRKDAKNE